MNKEENLPELANTGVQASAGHELQIAATSSVAIQEIQGAILVAKNFPRDENAVWAKVTNAIKRKSMAQAAIYSYPRGGSTIEGPSVNLARMIAGYYGNLRYGIEILRDDDDSRLIRGWCWDVENNLKVAFDDDFKKLIYRKQGGWIKPDERDLRELTFRRGAILVRNAILAVVPKDLIEDAMGIAKIAMKSNIKDPQGEKKRLILVLDEMGISVEMMNKRLGKKRWDKDDLVEAQAMINSIKEGNAKVRDYFPPEKLDPSKEVSTGKMNMKDATAGNPENHQGHEPQDDPPLTDEEKAQIEEDLKRETEEQPGQQNLV